MQQGASPNVVCATGETPFSAAVQAGTPECIKRLLEAGADVSLGDPLHYAVERKKDSYDVVRLLLHLGAPVNAIQFADPKARQLRHALC